MFIMKDIRTVVFDFGGVLIDLDMPETIRQVEELGVPAFDKMLVNHYVCHGFLGEFEKGGVSPGEFRSKIRDLASKPHLSDDAIDKAWCAMLTHVPAYKLDLLLELNKKYRVFMLSNTNKIHIDYSLRKCFYNDGHKLSDYFEKCFLSNEMGLSKPDPTIFKMFLSETGVSPEQTLYIDDAIKNVEAASSLGFKARLYVPGEDLRKFFSA